MHFYNGKSKEEQNLGQTIIILAPINIANKELLFFIQA